MKSNIFIPKLCKVGFNKRSDTYTGKLGYIIYNDGKVWRKEPSWESWREKYISQEEFDAKKAESFKTQVKNAENNYNVYKNDKNNYNKSYWDKFNSLDEYLKESRLDSIDNYRFNIHGFVNDESINPIEFNNEPTEGFVLNKKAGGNKYSWNPRQTYCRVYDPRGFEFEITIPNLLYILENATSSKGKGLEGKFIYGWDGKDLVLVPEEAPEYKEMIEFTQIQDLKVAKKDLKIGGIYMTKSGKKATYLGYFDYYGWRGDNEGKKHWFYTPDDYTKYNVLDLNNVKKYIEDEPLIVEILTELEKNERYKPKTILEYSYELKDETWVKDEFYKLNKSYYSYSYRKLTVYTPMKSKKNSYKMIYLYKYDGGKYIVYKSYNGKKEEEFNNFKELEQKYPIYSKTEIKKENG